MHVHPTWASEHTHDHSVTLSRPSPLSERPFLLREQVTDGAQELGCNQAAQELGPSDRPNWVPFPTDLAFWEEREMISRIGDTPYDRFEKTVSDIIDVLDDTEDPLVQCFRSGPRRGRGNSCLPVP